MMIRRSLNTFMIAFTSSDWTAYPFASQNRKDFDNLLDVYLDAVFFSKLDELDFAQEGHRLEFAEPDNPASKLVHKGVVYNEMKGAMSSVPAQLWQALGRYLYPTTTYHHNSGGDPEHIPDLTYEELKAFYRTHYHPSNAIFMTYGDIPAVEHQAAFEERALNRFEPLDTIIAVGEEKRYHAPIAVEQAYPLEEGEDPTNKTHVVVGWLLGKSTHLQDALEAELLTAILLDNSASPLRQALETTDLGQAPSPLCGLDDSQYEMAFACGLEGCANENAPQVEQLILETLRRVADEGVDQELVESALHQLELEQRDVTGDGMPYGLHLIMTGLSAATHRGDPIALLDQEAALTGLREKIHQPDFIPGLVRKLLLDNPHRLRLSLRPDIKIHQPDFIPGLVRKLLLDNPHRLRLSLRPDTHYIRNAQEHEAKTLEAIRATLSDTEREHIIAQARALEERQNAQMDDSILPKVGLEDIPHAMAYTQGSEETLDPNDPSSYRLRRYSAGTNGLVYQQLTCKLPALTEAQQALLPYYCHCLTELGIGDQDYLQTQRWQARAVGSISAFSNVRGATDDVQRIDGYLTVSAKALARNHNAMSELIKATVEL